MGERTNVEKIVGDGLDRVRVPRGACRGCYGSDPLAWPLPWFLALWGQGTGPSRRNRRPFRAQDLDFEPELSRAGEDVVKPRHLVEPRRRGRTFGRIVAKVLARLLRQAMTERVGDLIGRDLAGGLGFFGLALSRGSEGLLDARLRDVRRGSLGARGQNWSGVDLDLC